MNKAYLLLGGNLGNREKNIDDALKLLEQKAGNILLQSSLYETASWGNTQQPDFLNKVIYIRTAVSAERLLGTILEIEIQLGRKRSIKNASRTIDIDILFFNEDIISLDNLVVPHPEIQNRMFVLKPLAEIAGDLIHPITKETINVLLNNCKDQLNVNLFNQ